MVVATRQRQCNGNGDGGAATAEAAVSAATVLAVSLKAFELILKPKNYYVLHLLICMQWKCIQ